MRLDGKAQKRLDSYLADVRASLQGCHVVDADEVERDIREHIEHELEDAPEPVSAEDLDKVLNRLGSPTQWVPDEDLSAWRRFVHRLRRGPEDWRLAYVSFGLFIIALVLTRSCHYDSHLHDDIHYVHQPYMHKTHYYQNIAWVTFLASFFLARAAVATVPDGRLLGGQRWLLYPVLIMVYLFVGFWVVAGPTLGLFIFTYYLQGAAFNVFPWSLHDPWAYWPIALSFVAGLSGLWWFLLTVIQKVWPGLPGFVFRPFLDRPRAAAVNALMALSLVLFAVGTAGGVLLLVFPGWYDWLQPIVAPAAA